jgi:hypothetical protein
MTASYGPYQKAICIVADKIREAIDEIVIADIIKLAEKGESHGKRQKTPRRNTRRRTNKKK